MARYTGCRHPVQFMRGPVTFQVCFQFREQNIRGFRRQPCVMTFGAIEEAVLQQGDATNEIARSIQDAACAAQSLTEPARHVFEETETTNALTNDVRKALAQITEDMPNLKTSVIAVVRQSTDENFSNANTATTDDGT